MHVKHIMQVDGKTGLLLAWSPQADVQRPLHGDPGGRKKVPEEIQQVSKIRMTWKTSLKKVLKETSYMMVMPLVLRILALPLQVISVCCVVQFGGMGGQVQWRVDLHWEDFL